MRLRTIAPVPVDFQLAPGAAARDPEAYDEFWRRARDLARRDLAGGASFLHVHARRDEPPEPQYLSIAGDALARPLELVRFDIGRQELASPDAPTGSSLLRDAATGARLDLLDNGIVLAECTFDLPDDLQSLEELVADAVAGDDDATPDQVMEAVSTAAQAVVVDVVGEAMRDRVGPLLAALRDVPGASRVVSDPVNPAVVRVGPQLDVPMWVARQLTVPRPTLDEDDEVATIVAAWLRDVPAGTRTHLEVLASGDEDHVTRWLHYVAVDGEASGPGDAGRGQPRERDDVWRALCVAQWTYAALDVVDRRLAGVLAQAMADDDRWELGQLRTELERLARRATLVQLQRDEVTKYLHRDVRREFRAILRWWDFDELVAQPVATKVAMCRERIEDLEQARSRRSEFVTDLILQALVITSMLGTIIGLAQFGRSITTDPAFSGADVGRGNIVGWFAAQPADALLVLSGGLGLLVLLPYLYYRRYHQ